MWPAPEETIQHMCLDCHMGSVYETVRWRSMMLKPLKQIRRTFTAAKEAGTNGAQALTRALRVLTRHGHRDEKDWDAWCDIMGGLIPEWNAGAEKIKDLKKKHDKENTKNIWLLQTQLTARLREWTKYMGCLLYTSPSPRDA